MSGTISFGNDRWPMSGWLFSWVVGFLAVNVEQWRLAADIDRVRVGQCGVLDVDVFGSEAAGEMRALLSNRLLGAAAECFPADMRGRAAALRVLGGLAVSAARPAVSAAVLLPVNRTVGRSAVEGRPREGVTTLPGSAGRRGERTIGPPVRTE
jgi:hypothetical protein